MRKISFINKLCDRLKVQKICRHVQRALLETQRSRRPVPTYFQLCDVILCEVMGAIPAEQKALEDPAEVFDDHSIVFVTIHWHSAKIT